jgi:hypothetical protein
MSGSRVVQARSGDWHHPTSKPDEMLAVAEALLRDAEALNDTGCGSQYLLLIHSVEVALKSYLLRNSATMEELRGFGRDISRLLAEARKHGLTTSHSLTDNVVFRLKKSAERIDARCDFSFETLPPANEAIPIAWSVLRDVAAKPRAPAAAVRAAWPARHPTASAA